MTYLALVTAVCPECGRAFDLGDENQADEWYHGHDCEADTRSWAYATVEERDALGW